MEELLDVRVVGHRPCVGGPGLFDVDRQGIAAQTTTTVVAPSRPLS